MLLVQIDEQILTIARAYQLPSEALSLRLFLLSSLQSQLRSVYPSSLLVPFGSTVLGLATPSSDLDATLLLEPSVDDKFFFIESDYLNAIGQSTMSSQGVWRLPDNKQYIKFGATCLYVQILLGLIERHKQYVPLI